MSSNKPSRRAAFIAPVLVMALAHMAQATVIYDTTGGAENGGDPVVNAGPILADRFVAPFAGTLTSITLNLTSAQPPASQFTVDLFADNGSTGPGAATLVATVPDTALTAGFSLLTFTPATPIALATGTSYYAGIQDPTLTSAAQLGNTVDPAVLARPDVVAGASYYNNGGVQANFGGPYELIVNETAVPEPLSIAVMIVGLATLGLIKRYNA